MFRSAVDHNAAQMIPTEWAGIAQTELQHPSMGADRLLLTVPEAARRLGIGRSLLYELLADDQIDSIQVGRLRRIPIDALVAYIQDQRKSGFSASKPREMTD